DQDEAHTADSVPGFGTPAAKPQNEATAAKKLPEDVTFYSGDSADDTRSMNAEQQMGNAGWAKPILFYSDGTSTTARVVLVNRRNRFVVINLRGLTGIAQVSELMDSGTVPR